VNFKFLTINEIKILEESNLTIDPLSN